MNPVICLKVSILGGALAAMSSVLSHSQVVISEVMADNKSYFVGNAISDWMEIYNPGTQPISIANWSLTDTATDPGKWRFPNNATLAGGSYLVISLDSSRPASTSSGGLNTGFSLKASGDNIELHDASGRLVDSIRFGPQAPDYSIGALPAGTRNIVLNVPTPGAANVAQNLGPQNGLKVNEWMASPSSGDDWFEVYNSSTLPVQLTGLSFVDAGQVPSPVAPLSFIGIGNDAFLRIWANNSTNDNEVNFRLGAGGDSIAIRSGATTIDSVVFGQQTDDRSEGRLPDGSGTPQPLNLATPGKSNLVLYEGLRVNEVLTHTDAPLQDAVEFYNSTGAPVDVSGWYLSNSRSELKKYKMPAGSIIPARGFLVVYENQFKNPPEGFTFNSAHGDRVVLSQANASGNLTGYIVEQEFDAAARGVSFGHYDTSAGSLFVPMLQPTFGAAPGADFTTGRGASNSAPLVGPIVISEIMYSPNTNSLAFDEALDEYIELANITSSPVNLFDSAHPTNTWKLSKGISFLFPRNIGIPAQSSILVVPFNPDADPTQLAAFRQKYSISANVPIYGPYEGKLDNGGEAIALTRPDEPQDETHPDVGFVPYVLIDRIDYGDASPWPTGPDGTGQSLQRKSLTAFGNDPANWQGAPPAPGQIPTTGTPGEVKFSQIQIANGNVNLTFSSTAGRSYAIQYRSGFGSGTFWRTLTTVNATGTTTTYADPITADKVRFYQVSTN